MPFEEIKSLLQDSIGLHPGSVGDASIERAIVHRMNASSIEDEKRYMARLLADKDELEELVEEVVVPETWFFRNLVPFETLAKCIPELNGSSNMSGQPVRILSIPCSTGEEPYSIAISLLKGGMRIGGFQIDAVDISNRALQKARKAIYGNHSFRESDGYADPGYFKDTGNGYEVLPDIRQHVNFIKGNILKDTLAAGPDYYDIIFCRNLLIYFNRDTQKTVLEKLHIVLKENGILFIGHAETVEADSNLFARLNVPRAFAYKKRTTENSLIAENKDKKPESNLEDIYNQLLSVTLKDIELSKKHRASVYHKPEKTVKKPISRQNSQLLNVDKLIEQGRLNEASTLCEKWIEDRPEDAQGYYYLGLLSSLEGNLGSADALLRKAIYLDPNHHKALGLSALLAEQRGDSGIAETMRFRELRAKSRIK